MLSMILGSNNSWHSDPFSFYNPGLSTHLVIRWLVPYNAKPNKLWLSNMSSKSRLTLTKPEPLFYTVDEDFKMWNCFKEKISVFMTFEVILGLGRCPISWPWCNIVPFQRVTGACRRYQNGPAFTSDAVSVFACLHKVMWDRHASCHF